jgi:hypothetical protein
MMRSAGLKRLFHPATAQLHAFQIRARLRSLLERVQTPRRRGLVLLSLLLGCVWLGQAVAGIFLREPADPGAIRFWIPAAMVVYCLYHLVKILTRTPETPFEWTSAETELLLGAPLTRLQIITWRLRSIFTAAVAKAACFALVMSPDVPSVPLALVGMLGGLLMIDLLRLVLGMAVNAMTDRERWLCRIGLVTPLVGLVAWAMYCCLATMNVNNSPAQFSVTLMVQTSKVLTGLLAVEPFSWLLQPFRLFSSVIFADGSFGQMIGSSVLAISLLGFTLVGMLSFDRICQHRMQRMEADSWSRLDARSVDSGQTRLNSKASGAIVKAPWRFRGVGPIAWRQLLGAWHYRNAVRFALLVPTLLCCLPMFADANKETMMMNVGGSLVFYTFLLLPSGLILDYRRDIDRMAVLKSLPISPWALTIGQLATPVTLASLFQIMVLTVGVLTDSITAFQATIAFVVLIPFNVLNFALENYLFMLSPYRRNEEGVMVFVRTILTFTAKGIMFAIAFAITITWVILSLQWGNALGLGSWAGPALFAVGIWLLVGAAAWVFATLLTRRIASFDVSIDSPVG